MGGTPEEAASVAWLSWKARMDVRRSLRIMVRVWVDIWINMNGGR